MYAYAKTDSVFVSGVRFYNFPPNIMICSSTSLLFDCCVASGVFTMVMVTSNRRTKIRYGLSKRSWKIYVTPVKNKNMDLFTNYLEYIFIHKYYMIYKQIFLIKFLNGPRLILLLSGKWFQVLLCISDRSIKYQSFVFTQLNYVAVLLQAIPFNISHSFSLSLNVIQFYLT